MQRLVGPRAAQWVTPASNGAPGVGAAETRDLGWAHSAWGRPHAVLRATALCQLPQRQQHGRCRHIPRLIRQFCSWSCCEHPRCRPPEDGETHQPKRQPQRGEASHHKLPLGAPDVSSWQHILCTSLLQKQSGFMDRTCPRTSGSAASGRVPAQSWPRGTEPGMVVQTRPVPQLTHTQSCPYTVLAPEEAPLPPTTP